MHNKKETPRADRSVLGVHKGCTRCVCVIAIATKSIASDVRR